MAEKKIIAVVGATGAQGGGLVRAILSDVEQRLHRARTYEKRQLGQGDRTWPSLVPRLSPPTLMTWRV